MRSICILAALAAVAFVMDASRAGERPPLRDPQDGAFDLSALLDKAYGFVPILAPITEPAVGYGAMGALVFIDRNAPVNGTPVRPNLAAIGGLATENGTRGFFGAHVGHWNGGRLRTLLAAADADVNLDFFGLGGAGVRPDDEGLEYTIRAQGGVVGATYRPWPAPLWIGARYALASTRVRLRDEPLADFIKATDRELRLGALTPSFVYDTRDNNFTPTHGVYADLSTPLFRESFGSERDFELLKLSAQYFRPLRADLYFGVRAGWRDSSSDTPFFMRPYVSLRGVQAMRYQGAEVVEAEGELRWQWNPRFSAVTFAGGGTSKTRNLGDESVVAGGIGFRYLIARTYGLHMGVDVAWGPDDPAFYVTFGSAWLRP